MERSEKKNNYNIVKKEFIKLYKSVREKSKILSDLWNLTEYDTQLSLYDRLLTVRKLQNLLMI